MARSERPSDPEVIEALCTLGPKRTARKFKVSERAVHYWKNDIEAKTGKALPIYDTRRVVQHVAAKLPHRETIEVENGIVLVGSDGHYFPGAASTAHRAFVRFCKGDMFDVPVRAVVMNGDAFDGARISRHPPIGWETRPSVVEELEAVKLRLGEIEKSAPTRAKLVWPCGNHDIRFETRLAAVAPEYARVHGLHLKDHFSERWRPCWSAWVNNDTVIKHRPIGGGVNATRNSTMRAGVTMVTGHLHSLKVTPFSDYAVRPRWGVDTGCLAEPYGPQFVDYTEDAPLDWRSGFAVLTYRKGQLLWPELVHVFDANHVEFRGQLIKV